MVTGGINSRTRVAEYSETSFLRELPGLQEGRWLHGCGYYDNSEGTKVTSLSPLSLQPSLL